MYELPEEYKTGNPKIDAAAARAFAKNPPRTTHAQQMIALHLEERKNKSRITVSSKERRTYKDGTLFASEGELIRWDYLLIAQQSGLITRLQKQVPFVLQKEFISRQYGEQKPIIYVADFVYTNISLRKDCQGKEVVEDVKGHKDALTEKYKLKKRIFLYKFGEYLFFEVYPDS